jgi:hypothetical protein
MAIPVSRVKQSIMSKTPAVSACPTGAITESRKELDWFSSATWQSLLILEIESTDTFGSEIHQ